MTAALIIDSIIFYVLSFAASLKVVHNVDRGVWWYRGKHRKNGK